MKTRTTDKKSMCFEAVAKPKLATRIHDHLLASVYSPARFPSSTSTSYCSCLLLLGRRYSKTIEGRTTMPAKSSSLSPFMDLDQATSDEKLSMLSILFIFIYSSYCAALGQSSPRPRKRKAEQSKDTRSHPSKKPKKSKLQGFLELPLDIVDIVS